jgi:hypothetical protein
VPGVLARVNVSASLAGSRVEGLGETSIRTKHEDGIAIAKRGAQ